MNKEIEQSAFSIQFFKKPQASELQKPLLGREEKKDDRQVKLVPPNEKQQKFIVHAVNKYGLEPAIDYEMNVEEFLKSYHR